MNAILRIAFVLAAGAAAALAASFLLLGVAASSDPVGRLSPRSVGSAPAAAARPGKPAKASPAPRPEQERHADD